MKVCVCIEWIDEIVLDKADKETGEDGKCYLYNEVIEIDENVLVDENEEMENEEEEEEEGEVNEELYVC